MGELEKATELIASGAQAKSYLYYGPPGSGKTTTFLHLPGKKFLIDADNKAHEIENITDEVRSLCTVWSYGEAPLNPNLEVIGKNTKIKDNPNNFSRVVAIVNELIDLARKCRRENKPFPFEAAGFDSWSAVSDDIFEKVKFDNGKSALAWQEWGLVHSNNLAVLKGFLQLPCTRVVIAHDRHITIRDKDTQEVKEEYIRPAIAGQLSDSFGKYFSEVYYFKGRLSSGNYAIQTVKDDLLMARTAKNLPKEVIIDKDTKRLVIK